MFSKALFKQSCKANGFMWGIVTFAVCFMLACLMIITGSSNLSNMKVSIEDSIIVDTINSKATNSSINLYKNTKKYMQKFDLKLIENLESQINQEQIKELDMYKDKLVKWYDSKPSLEIGLPLWQSQMPKPQNQVEQIYLKLFVDWFSAEPQKGTMSDEEYQKAIEKWKLECPYSSKALLANHILNQEEAKKIITNTLNDINNEIKKEFAESEAETLNLALLFTMNVEGLANDEYNKIEENSAPTPYDFTSLLLNIPNSDFKSYEENQTMPLITKDILIGNRYEYLVSRATYSIPMLTAKEMSSEEMKNKLLEELKDYKVDSDKYDSFGLTYEKIKQDSSTDIVTFEGRLGLELSKINDEITNIDEYFIKVDDISNKLNEDLAMNILTELPTEVASALEELGKMDLYSLLIGSIFFKIAGLLLPIIYMIMTANNLISSQVDTGSMAYVLSTSTKRQTVTFTQACYLIGSLFVMFLCTTLTSIICFSCINISDTELTITKLILINLAAFLVLFALAGINFFTSCYFDKSKKSMALGGGLSMFFLVATMLGLFGSPVIPSVVRIDALNNFNYVSIISLFDAVSILEGTYVFIYKLAILALIGIVGFVAGSIKFRNKDLPL